MDSYTRHCHFDGEAYIHVFLPPADPPPIGGDVLHAEIVRIDAPPGVFIPPFTGGPSSVPPPRGEPSHVTSIIIRGRYVDLYFAAPVPQTYEREERYTMPVARKLRTDSGPFPNLATSTLMPAPSTPRRAEPPLTTAHLLESSSSSSSSSPSTLRQTARPLVTPIDTRATSRQSARPLISPVDTRTTANVASTSQRDPSPYARASMPFTPGMAPSEAGSRSSSRVAIDRSTLQGERQTREVGAGPGSQEPATAAVITREAGVALEVDAEGGDSGSTAPTAVKDERDRQAADAAQEQPRQDEERAQADTGGGDSTFGQGDDEIAEQAAALSRQVDAVHLERQTASTTPHAATGEPSSRIPPAAPHSARSCFTTPWLPPTPGSAALPNPTAAQTKRDDAGDIRRLREAMVNCRSLEALESATGDVSTSHFARWTEAQFVQRRESSGGRMFMADLEAACHLAIIFLIFRAHLGNKSAVDLRIFLSSFSSRELALFIFCQVISMAPFYARTPQDVRDIMATMSELNARNCNSSGTYMLFIETENARGPQYESVLWKYTGETNWLARRAGEHDREIQGILKAQKDGTQGDVKAGRSRMKLLYREKILDWWPVILTRGPDTRDQQVRVDWLEATFQRMGGCEAAPGRKLVDMGSRRCVSYNDRSEFIDRQNRAVCEHAFTAFFGSATDGYDDWDLFAGARYDDYPFARANRDPPSLGFSDLQGSLASKLPDSIRPGKKGVATAFDTAVVKRNAPSFHTSVLRSSAPSAQSFTSSLSRRHIYHPGRLTINSLPQAQLDSPSSSHPPNLPGAPAAPTPASRLPRAPARLLPLAQAHQRPIRISDDDVDDEDGSDDEELQSSNDAVAAQEGPLHLVYRKPIDKVQYVDDLPSVSTGADLAGVAWRVDEGKQLLYRLSPFSAEERYKTWMAINQSSFAARVSSGVLRVKVAPSLPTLDVRLKATFPNGDAFLILRSRQIAGRVVQPRSASALASYVLDRYEVTLFSKAAPGSSLRIEPIAEDIGAQWEEVLCPMGLVAAMRSQEAVAYSKTESLLSCVGVRLRGAGSRMALGAGSRDGWRTLRLPGDEFAHAEFGTFGEPDRSTLVTEVPVPPSFRQQDVVHAIFSVGPANRKGFYDQLRVCFVAGDSVAPLPRGSMQAVAPGTMEEWAICYLLNLAILSRGCVQANLVVPKGDGVKPWESPKRAAQPLPDVGGSKRSRR
ncbi:hypothetical protein BDZ90DRAFT_232536 [Jaminaea rosea]|uniref:Uncharacterized protein n=1 Tax=Jaminaea rosea TaxID=1569628 RepID=A0A316UQJ9_9BASI|nr:hypothetical protein BDZ90DRAFT_232536 [Jaminaea rosea]PWN27566.1 hypothetical protein BDZ90DRAFT_232536 [Jaminaea rosea]